MEPMIFGSDTAFKQLEEKGQVSSARSTPRKEEEVWIRKTRTGPKEFNAEILNVTEIKWTDEKNLLGHLHDHDIICGFDSAYKWMQEIKRLNGGEVPYPLYIHHVLRKGHPILQERNVHQTLEQIGEVFQ